MIKCGYSGGSVFTNEQEQGYFITEAELEQVARDAFCFGFRHCLFGEDLIEEGTIERDFKYYWQQKKKGLGE